MNKLGFLCLMATCILSNVVAFDQNCCDPCDPCESGFNGFYVGGNVGVGSHIARRNDLDGFLVDNSGWATLTTSALGGVQAGYDYQWCNSVFGIMVDWTKCHLNKTLRSDPNGGDPNSYIKSNLNWFTTIKGRAGLTVNNALMYLTLGAAVAKFKNTWRDDPDVFHSNNTRWGWTGGLGSEVKLCGNWSADAEVFFLHFSEKTKSFSNNSNTFGFGHNDSSWVGRVGINYRFGKFPSCR